MKRETVHDYVTLRRRPRPSGVVALLLRYSYRGRRREESLRLYLVPEVTREDRRKNRDTLALAESIRAERLTQIKQGLFHIGEEEQQVRLWELFDSLIGHREGKATLWECARNMLKKYEKGDPFLSDLTRAWLEGFVKFLEDDVNMKKRGRALSPNTRAMYYSKVVSVIKLGVKRGYIKKDPSEGVEGPKREETERSYLTGEELRVLSSTPCDHAGVREPFLFSCLTGLRFSDISRLTWGEVGAFGGMVRLTFKQKKTGGLLYLDINGQAAALMGERGRDSDRVFPLMPWPSTANVELRVWARAAGISKHITFHSGRHTFATLLLTSGADLYTVSKLLGHTNVKTTQIYAKIVDEKKREAVALLPDVGIK